MAGRTLPLADVKEVHRLRKIGLSVRAIARALKIHRDTVTKYLAVPMEGLEVAKQEPAWTQELDWCALNSEIVKGVPLQILWEELAEAGKIKVQYPAFWKQLRKRCPNVTVTMHRSFTPGERCEIDYCDGIDLLDPISGELERTHLFVGVLCYSRYTYAEFSLSQKSEDFLSSHVRMLEFFGGTPLTLAPDNLKSAVTKAHRYDPVTNPAYTRLAEHYDVAITPARVMRPKDKALVERSIQIFQKWFYYRVRRRTFTSLVELNQCLREHLELFNAKIHRIFKRSRAEMFVDEKAKLRSLPESRYEVATHHSATLHPDCHLSFEKNYYSAPYQLRGKLLDIWVSQGVIEIFHGGERVGLHARHRGHAKFITDRTHYPPQHQAYYEATPQALRSQAAKLGPEISKLIHKLLNGDNPLKHLRRAQGIIRLEKKYGKESLEKACAKANLFEQTSYAFIERLLKQPHLLRERSAAQPINRTSNELLRGEELFN